MIAVTAFASRAALMEGAAQRLAAAIEAAIAERGQACIALSGGSTPEPAYAALAKAPLDWTKVTIALVDERCVAASDPASNEGLLRRALAPALNAGAKLLPMSVANMTPAAAASAANQVYQALRLDFVLLGMGGDGHTASWFPQASGLEAALDPEAAQAVVAVHAPGAAGAADRLTLTRAALARAGRIALLITGEAKRAVLEHAQANSLPVAALFDGLAPAPEVLWAA